MTKRNCRPSAASALLAGAAVIALSATGAGAQDGPLGGDDQFRSDGMGAYDQGRRMPPGTVYMMVPQQQVGPGIHDPQSRMTMRQEPPGQMTPGRIVMVPVPQDPETRRQAFEVLQQAQRPEDGQQRGASRRFDEYSDYRAAQLEQFDRQYGQWRAQQLSEMDREYERQRREFARSLDQAFEQRQPDPRPQGYRDFGGGDQTGQLGGPGSQGRMMYEQGTMYQEGTGGPTPR